MRKSDYQGWTVVLTVDGKNADDWYSEVIGIFDTVEKAEHAMKGMEYLLEDQPHRPYGAVRLYVDTIFDPSLAEQRIANATEAL